MKRCNITHEGFPIFDFRPVTAALEYLQSRGRNDLRISLNCAARQDRIFVAPDDERGQPPDAFQMLGKRGVVHIGLPGKLRRFNTRVFPAFDYFRRCGVVERSELFRFYRIGDRASEIFRRRHDIHIGDIAFGRFDAERRDERHTAELRGIVDSHFGSDPAAERKPQDIDGSDLLRPQQAAAQAGKICDIGNPFRALATKTRCDGHDQPTCLGDLFMPLLPLRRPQLVMQDEKRTAFAGFQQHDAHFADFDFAGIPAGHDARSIRLR